MQESNANGGKYPFIPPEFQHLVLSGKFFSVDFIKRTTGLPRKMLCRVGVKKHLRGGNIPYDFQAAKLLPVYDLQKREYRLIPIDSITHINNKPFSAEL